MANRQTERFRAASRILDGYYDAPGALAHADALLALVEADGGRIDGKGEITEELDAESRILTVYPCPRCGESDRDENAVMMGRVNQVAKSFGWDGMEPMIDWLGGQMADLKAALEAVQHWTARSEKAEQGLRRTSGLVGAAIRYSAGATTWQMLKDAVMRYEREVGEVEG